MIDKSTFFQQAVLRICSTLDLQEGLNRIRNYIQDFIPLDTLEMGIIRSDLNQIVIIHRTTDTEKNVPPISKMYAVPQRDWSVMTDLGYSKRKVCIVNDPMRDPAMRHFIEQLEPSPPVSIMTIPLELEGEMLGIAGFVAKGNNRYTHEHAELAAMLSEPFAIALSNGLKHQEIIRLKNLLSEEYHALRNEVGDLTDSEIIGANAGLKKVMAQVREVASSTSPVLLLGETGVGKDIFACKIHALSSRRSAPFIRVNCGAIPETLIDSELFGYEQGAFTGAEQTRRGRFERADQGTLFLDEIGELPLQAQVRLLHVLQNEEIERVGGTKTIPVNIRLIFATHRNLEAMVKEGRFRQDLYFRLNLFPITIPPLRERIGDLPSLIHYLVDKKSQKLKIRDRPVLASGSIEALMKYNWPGNIRELENTIERALIQFKGGRLHLIPPLPANTSHKLKSPLLSIGSPSPITTLDDAIRAHIQRALQVAGGKIAGSGGAAELLNVHPNTLRKKMDKLSINYKRKKHPRLKP